MGVVVRDPPIEVDAGYGVAIQTPPMHPGELASE